MSDTLMEPPQADVLWRRLAQTGELQKLYRDGDPALGVQATALRALFRQLDGSESVGATLGVCVQATTTLPLIAAAARRNKRSSPLLSVVADGMLRGEQMAGLAATDSTPGSDLTALATTVAVEDEYLMVSGRKEWIANATHATNLLVLARHRDGPGFANFTWVVVPTDAPGVTVEPASAPLFRGSGTGHASFQQVTLPLTHLGGSPGRGLIDFYHHISVERLASADWGHAMCQRVLRETVTYLRQRGAGSANLWGKEEIQRRIARCLVATVQLGVLIDTYQHSIADQHDHLAASLVKASAAQTVDEVLSVASYLQGARAFNEGGLQTLRAQAGLWRIGGGTYDVMLSTIAEHTDQLLSSAS